MHTRRLLLCPLHCRMHIPGSTHTAQISRRHRSIRISGDRDSHMLSAALVASIQPCGRFRFTALDGLDSVGTKMASRGELSCSLVQGSTVRRLTVPFQTALKGERVKIGQPFPRRLKPSRQLQPERSVSSSTGTMFSALTSQDTDRLTRLPLTMLNFQQGKTNQMAHTCLKQRTNQTNTISSNNRSNQCAGILHSVHMINPHLAPSHSEPQPDGTLAPFSYLGISGSGGRL